MEPRPYGRGDSHQERHDVARRGALQWSHGHTAVETVTATLYTLIKTRLQWSHGHTAVETAEHVCHGHRPTIPLACERQLVARTNSWPMPTGSVAPSL